MEESAGHLAVQCLIPCTLLRSVPDLLFFFFFSFKLLSIIRNNQEGHANTLQNGSCVGERHDFLPVAAFK